MKNYLVIAVLIVTNSWANGIINPTPNPNPNPNPNPPTLKECGLTGTVNERIADCKSKNGNSALVAGWELSGANGTEQSWRNPAKTKLWALKYAKVDFSRAASACGAAKLPSTANYQVALNEKWNEVVGRVNLFAWSSESYFESDSYAAWGLNPKYGVLTIESKKSLAQVSCYTDL